MTAIVLGLCRVGAVFDSPRFAGKLTEIATALATFGEDLGVPHSSAHDGVTLREPLLSTQEMAAFPMNRQQTLQVLRVLERLDSLFGAVADADATSQRTVALSELATVAAVYGHRLGRTAQLLTMRHDHRAQRPTAEIAADLGITEPDVKQMLREAQALVDGPLEQPAPPPWRPCPASAHTTAG
ncbi:hypothetical protein CF165_49350 [Amycolatopsis vastitatis]|uniref:Uncharacterized protein n=1 Tax=Amycolatopsis vastitatis TaxID=1905142 RepID=A0A229SJM9_9PSEU|nr:hypothetical protein CF165_49350 [Amycolatopsis vastitatis]